MKETFNHELPSTTVLQSRLKIFQATRRPKFLKDEKFVNIWGTLVVTGKLGQGHADVLEALLYCAEAQATLEDGRFKILIDPYIVRKYANVSSTKELISFMDDLMMAIIHFDYFSHKKKHQCVGAGHLIDHWQIAKRSNGDKITRKNPLNQGQRPLLRIEIGKVLSNFILDDTWITVNPNNIAKLKNGVSQAVARYVRGQHTEPRGGWILDNLLVKLTGVEPNSQQIRDRRRELRKEIVGLELAGTSLIGNRIHKSKKVIENHKNTSSVEQTSGRVEQILDGVEQISEVWSKPPMLAVISDLSDTPLLGCNHPSN